LNFLLIRDKPKTKESVMLSLPEALPLPLGGGREGLAERNDRRPEASVNQRKRVEYFSYDTENGQDLNIFIEHKSLIANNLSFN
jgi:hypothetical protein